MISQAQQSAIEGFAPGSYWTPERAGRAVAAMTSLYEAPGFREAVDASRDSFADTHQPGVLQTPSEPTGVIAPEQLSYRRAEPADIPRLNELISSASLPALFVEEFIGGFVVVEHSGAIIGCGGGEIYEDCSVIRSVVVEQAARGLRLGRRIAELLIEDARQAEVRDCYLVTADAWSFWKHVGFVDVPFEAWREPAQLSWQWRYLVENRAEFDAFGGHTMWRRIGG